MGIRNPSSRAAPGQAPGQQTLAPARLAAGFAFLVVVLQVVVFVFDAGMGGLLAV